MRVKASVCGTVGAVSDFFRELTVAFLACMEARSMGKHGLGIQNNTCIEVAEETACVI